MARVSGKIMKTIVIKIGGSVTSDANKRKKLLKRLIGLSKKQAVILVHGGKEQINEFLEKFGVKTKFVKGHRYTDGKALGIVAAVLNKVNQELTAEINSLGGYAVGLSGVDSKMLKAAQIKSLGLVGNIKSVDVSLIKLLAGRRIISVISPISSPVSGKTHMLNVNADSAASAVASALKAVKLIFVSDVPGIFDKNKKVILSMRISEIAALKKNGTVSGGMLPKIDGCKDAILKGVRQIIITDRLDNSGTKIVK
jgi:acetylglutamate kinase